MKKFLLLIFFNIFVCQIYGQATEWQYIITDSANREYYYKHNSHDTAWTKEISKTIIYFTGDKLQDKKVVDGYQINLYQFDCSDKKISIAQVNTYSKSGEVLKTTKIKDDLVEMDYVLPDSVGESFLQSFCSK